MTIGNYPNCSYIYIFIMLTTSLGRHHAWVQCKHILYHILQNIIYYGHTKKFIHYPMWSWDEVQHLLAQVKACENQWYDNKIVTMRRWGDLQLGFWITMTICNSLQFYVFLWVWVLSNKLQELQQMQLTICEIIYTCNLCNLISTMYE